MASERVRRQIDRLLDEAEEALNQDDWVRLLELSNRVLLLDPDNQDATAFQGIADRASSSSVIADETPSETMESQGSLDQPTSFADGRYVVKRFLGEGGKNKVYLAHCRPSAKVGHL